MRRHFLLLILPSMISGTALAVVPAKNPKQKKVVVPLKKEKEKKEEAPSLLEKIVTAPVTLVDDTQDLVDENVTRVANRLDSFFGTQRADDELNRSQIRILYDYRLSEAAPKSDFGFRVNLRLQNLEDFAKKTVQKFMGWDTDLTPQEEAKIAAAEKKKLDDPNRWLFRQDVGVIASIPPRVFYRTRLRKTWQGKHIVHRYVEELGWYSEEQWMNRSTFESDRAMSDVVLFRIFHEKNWAITDQEFTTAHGPSIIHRISESDAFSYNARVFSRIKGPLYLDGYSLSVSYRRRLRGNWLYGDMTPALDFPKVVSFRRTPSILFRIEILFGGIRQDITSTSQNTL